ncbi:TPA: hypothetical protein QHN36_003578 [Enterobacter bugandensis]|nr:hypothetical protein [Enterobacter bugandensis]
MRDPLQWVQRDPDPFVWIEDGEDRVREDLAVYCRLVHVFGSPNLAKGGVLGTLENWITRNRLFRKNVAGAMVPVSRYITQETLLRSLREGKLFLLTNGIY